LRQADVLQALTELVVTSQQIEILFETKNAEQAGQDPQAGHEVATLEAGEGVATDTHPLGEVGE
jgi:hypothetical protein